MERRYHRWFSPALGREMELLVFGHAGERLLAFPTSKGRFFAWEDEGLIEVLAPRIRAGRLQVVCVDSIDGESWYAAGRPPGERAARHAAYDRYLVEEVLPLMRWLNPSGAPGTAGCSFGAYHAMNFALRHPDAARRVIALSGVYDIQHLGEVDDEPAWPDGYTDETVYAHNPAQYVLHEQDPGRLEAWRGMDLRLATGCEDSGAPNHERFSRTLRSRDIPHTLTFVRGVAHDWPSWQAMLRGLFAD